MTSHFLTDMPSQGIAAASKQPQILSDQRESD
jgi:hypothetical protein